MLCLPYHHVRKVTLDIALPGNNNGYENKNIFMSLCVLFPIHFIPHLRDEIKYFVPRDKIKIFLPWGKNRNVVFRDKLEKLGLPILNFVP